MRIEKRTIVILDKSEKISMFDLPFYKYDLYLREIKQGKYKIIKNRMGVFK